MKLTGHFFKILNTTHTDSKEFSTRLALNPAHIVYKGHFPGYPVTPGVIQLQMVHELLEGHLSKSLKMKNMSQCKFLKILNPLETSAITVHLELVEQQGYLSVKARGENEADTFFKLRANYQTK